MRPVRFARDVLAHWNFIINCFYQSDEYKVLLCDFKHYNISSIIFQSQQWHMCTKICQLLKIFNNTTKILSGIYYPIINLFIIESLNILGAFDECMTQESKLVSCIEVMKSKWLDYYQNISIIYLHEMIFVSLVN